MGPQLIRRKSDKASGKLKQDSMEFYCQSTKIQGFTPSMIYGNYLSPAVMQSNFTPMHCKCPYSELFWSAFFRIRTECRKIRTRITPNTNTFHAAIVRVVKWNRVVKRNIHCFTSSPGKSDKRWKRFGYGSKMSGKNLINEILRISSRRK